MIGSRNVQARERRRQKLKGCIPTPPSDCQVQKLTLKENFGWRVLEKTQVDSYFPPLARHYEKPDISGNFEKVTYVLHMGGPATVVERPTAGSKKVEEPIVEELAPPRTVSPKPSCVTWASASSIDEHRVRKRQSRFSTDSKPPKLISGFYYTKRKDRSRSRSTDRSKDCGSKHKNALESAKERLLGHFEEEKRVKSSLMGDYAKMTESVDEQKEATRAQFSRIERKSRDGDEDRTRRNLRERESTRSVGKKASSGWQLQRSREESTQLRAGASRIKRTKTMVKTNNERERGVKTKEEDLLEGLKITSVNVGRGEPTEEAENPFRN